MVVYKGLTCGVLVRIGGADQTYLIATQVEQGATLLAARSL